MRKLLLLHAVANLLLLAAGYYWLGVGETRAATLAWSALLALLLLAGTAVTYAAPLVYFRLRKDPSVREAWSLAMRNVLPLMAVTLLVVAIYWAIAGWDAAKPGLRLASWLTLKTRTPVKPATITAVFNAARWLVEWVLFPWLLLPLAAAVAARQRAGFGGWRFRLLAPLLLLLAFWVPFKVIGWTPLTGNFWLETLSFALRALLAYALFVGGWLMASAIIGHATAQEAPKATSAI
jgi:hypothetical protein